MATYAFNETKRLMMTAGLSLTASTTKALLVKTTFSSTAGSSPDKDITTISGFGTLGEFGGTGYTAGYGNRIVLDSKSVTTDTATDVVEFDATDEALGVLGTDGTLEGVLVYSEVGGSDATAVPLFFLDTNNYAPDGIATVTIAWHADGLANMA